MLIGSIFAQGSEFKPGGKLWGYFFGDFYYKLAGATASGVDSFNVEQGGKIIHVKRWGDGEFAQKAKDYYAFTFRRIYLGYDYNITPKLSTRILVEGSDVVLTSAGNRTFFVKALYLEWKDVLKNQTLRIGQISTPSWATFTEPIWSYRSVEKTIADFRGISRSNDVGIGLSGILLDLKFTPADTFMKPKSILNISYNFVYGNGTAAKPEDINRMKVYYGEAIFKIMGNLLLEGYIEYEPIISSAGLDSSQIVTKQFIGYQRDPFAIGVEFVQRTSKNAKQGIPVDSATSTRKDTTDLKQMGISIWARGQIIKNKLYAFVRYDIMNYDSRRRGWEYSDAKSVSNKLKYNETFFVIGLDWRPEKNVQFIPNLWMATYKDMTANIRDYKSVKRKPDIVVRLTFMVQF